jgi:hypothetical protein
MARPMLAFRLGKLQLLNPSKARQKAGTSPGNSHVSASSCCNKLQLPQLQHLLDFSLSQSRESLLNLFHAFTQPF